MTTATTEKPKTATVLSSALGHDLTKLVLAILRTMPDHWERMTEEMQNKRLVEIKETITTAVQEASQILLRSDFQAVACKLGKVTIGDEVKIDLAMVPGDKQRHALYDAKGKDVLLVLASSQQWLEKMDEIQADVDQKDLFNEDTSYSSALDQPKYRRDEPPMKPVGMTWAELKGKLMTEFPLAAEKDGDGPIEGTPIAGQPVPADLLELHGVIIMVWPTGEREPLSNYPFALTPGETLVQAMERQFPGCTFEIPPPADYLDTKGADITAGLPGFLEGHPIKDEGDVVWARLESITSPGDPKPFTVEVEDHETIREALQRRYPGVEFRLVPFADEEPTAEAPLEGDGIVEEGPLPPGSDTDASDLALRLTAIGMSIELQAVKNLMPEQRALTRNWLGNWLDWFEDGSAKTEAPARPHFLPLFTPLEKHIDEKPARGKKKR